MEKQSMAKWLTRRATIAGLFCVGTGCASSMTAEPFADVTAIDVIVRKKDASNFPPAAIGNIPDFDNCGGHPDWCSHGPIRTLRDPQSIAAMLDFINMRLTGWRSQIFLPDSMPYITLKLKKQDNYVGTFGSGPQGLGSSFTRTVVERDSKVSWRKRAALVPEVDEFYGLAKLT